MASVVIGPPRRAISFPPMTNRQTPRVILRRPRRGSFDGVEVLVVEMGLGGAKLEHPQRFDVGRAGTLSCGPLTTPAAVRYSVLLPAPDGFVYQSGVEFTAAGPAEKALLIDLLVREAEEQVVEWEANLAGDVPLPSRRNVRRSAVAPRFLSLRLLLAGWERSVTPDPNQPMDGVTILEGTPEDEVEMLCQTYRDADQATRELMRRMATLAILERMRAE